MGLHHVSSPCNFPCEVVYAGAADGIISSLNQYLMSPDHVLGIQCEEMLDLTLCLIIISKTKMFLEILWYVDSFEKLAKTMGE